MCLLAYRSSKHETTKVILAEFYLARDLRLPMDLLRGNPPDKKEPDTAKNCISRVRR